MTKIAVTGVTGNLGRVALEDLLTKKPSGGLIAIARSPEKAARFAAKGVEVRYGDFNTPSTLDAALAGVEQLLLVSGSDLTSGIRVKQHQASRTRFSAIPSTRRGSSRRHLSRPGKAVKLYHQPKENRSTQQDCAIWRLLPVQR